MSLKKQIVEDLEYFAESLDGETHKRYEYKGRYGPIIGIPGVLGGWTNDGLRKFMAINHVEGVLLNLGNLTHGVDSYLNLVESDVRKYHNPLLVGFSVGGFVALRYAEIFKAWQKIKGIVTIATPFKGNLKEFEFLGQTLQETSPRGELLKEILNIQPPEGKVISIFAKEDEHTPNPETIHLNWPTTVTGALSHGDVQNHQRWFSRTLKEILGIT